MTNGHDQLSASITHKKGYIICFFVGFHSSSEKKKMTLENCYLNEILHNVSFGAAFWHTHTHTLEFEVKVRGGYRKENRRA